MMEMMALEAYHTVYCCILLSPPMTYVNQLKALVTNEDYNYQHQCEQNGWTARGEYGENTQEEEV
jgi:hypothetical protein